MGRTKKNLAFQLDYEDFFLSSEENGYMTLDIYDSSSIDRAQIQDMIN